MTTATAFALQEARAKADQGVEIEIRRRRFANATGRKPGDQTPTLLYTHSLTFSGASPDAGAGGFGSPQGNPVYRAYRALKILHD